MSHECAEDEYPLNRAFAVRAWRTENNPWVPVERRSDGYIAQEIERLMEGNAPSLPH